MTSSHNIARNTTWLTLAYIGQKVFAFVYFTLIARWLGASDIGLYVFALSLTTILSFFVDFGLSPVLIREASKDRSKANLYLNNVLSLKIILGVIAFLIAILIINLLNKPSITQTMVYLAGIVMVLDSFTLSFWAIFRAWQNLKYEATSIVINQAIIFIIGLTGVILKLPLYILVIALIGGSAFSFFFSLFLVKFKLQFKFKFVWQKDIIFNLLKIALPFALASLFTRVYTYIDQVLLSILIGNLALGWYSVAYKITYAFQFLPASFAAAIYPAMSNYYVNDKDKLKLIFEKSMYFLIMLSIPLVFGVLFLADKLIILIYTAEYQPTILILQIFIFAVFSLFLNYPVGSVLNACDKQNINTLNMGITMILNIILNLLLIPRFQQLGAASAALISLTALFILNLYWVPKIFKYDHWFLIKKAALALLCSIIMSLVVILLKPYINLVILIILGAAIYIILLYLLKGFTKDDLKYIWQAVFKKSTPTEQETLSSS